MIAGARKLLECQSRWRASGWAEVYAGINQKRLLAAHGPESQGQMPGRVDFAGTRR
jgi:hypothetical protein